MVISQQTYGDTSMTPTNYVGNIPVFGIGKITPTGGNIPIRKKKIVKQHGLVSDRYVIKKIKHIALVRHQFLARSNP